MLGLNIDNSFLVIYIWIHIHNTLWIKLIDYNWNLYISLHLFKKKARIEHDCNIFVRFVYTYYNLPIPRQSSAHVKMFTPVYIKLCFIKRNLDIWVIKDLEKSRAEFHPGAWIEDNVLFRQWSLQYISYQLCLIF